MYDFDRREKVLARENTIRNMSMAAWRIKTNNNDQCEYKDIKKECPQFSPRQRAMVRSIVVNDWIVDEPIDWWE